MKAIHVKINTLILMSALLPAQSWAAGGSRPTPPPPGDGGGEQPPPDTGTKPKIPKSKDEVAKAHPQPPPRPSCVREVKKTIIVKGTLDGEGCLYTWRGAGYPSKCQAPEEISEREPPMFKLEPGATLKNLQMECALDGIHTTKNNVIDNIINRDVEEDAITIGENITIKNSQFYFCQDKCLQSNKGSNAKIFNNKFYHASFPILANTGRNFQVSGNYFYNVNRAIRANGSESRVTAENNTVDRANCYLAASNKATMENWGGENLSNVKTRHCEESGGRIVTK